MSNIEVKKSGAVVPSEEMNQKFNEVKENLEAMGEAKLPRAKMSADGLALSDEGPAVKEIEGTIIHAKRVNQYYEKPYDPANVVPPDCFSMNGLTPDPASTNPQSKACMGCPKAEWGSNNRNKGKACRNLKPLYVLLGDASIIPRQLTVPPTSLKSVNAFLMNLTELGIPFRKAKVKIEAYKESPRDTYCKLKFSYLGKLDDARANDVAFLHQNWLPVMDAQAVEHDEISDEAVSTEPVVNEMNQTQSPPTPKAKKEKADAKGQF